MGTPCSGSHVASRSKMMKYLCSCGRLCLPLKPRLYSVGALGDAAADDWPGGDVAGEPPELPDEVSELPDEASEDMEDAAVEVGAVEEKAAEDMEDAALEVGAVEEKAAEDMEDAAVEVGAVEENAAKDMEDAAVEESAAVEEKAAEDGAAEEYLLQTDQVAGRRSCASRAFLTSRLMAGDGTLTYLF